MSHADIDIGGFYISFDKKVHDYTPYDLISGALCVNFRSDVKSKGLVLKITGKLGVLFQENETNLTDDGKRTNTYTTANTFLNERIPFVLPPENQDTTTISKGYHEFKFSFRLIDFLKTTNITPQRVSAAYPFTSEHEYGSVKYIITGALLRSANDFDYQTVQFIRITSAVSDIDEMHKYFVPYKTEQTRDNSILPTSKATSASGGSSNSSLKVVVNKTAYKPGETIDCLIKLENENALRKFSKLYVKLIQTATFHSKEPIPRFKTVKHDIFSYKQTDFDNNRSYEMDELIQIPRSTQPPSTLDQSHHIQYKYDLKLELYSTIKFLPSAPSQPIEVTIPIIVYNELV